MLGGDISAGMYRKAMSTHIVSRATLQPDGMRGKPFEKEKEGTPWGGRGATIRGSTDQEHTPVASAILLHLGNWSVMLTGRK